MDAIYFQRNCTLEKKTRLTQQINVTRLTNEATLISMNNEIQGENYGSPHVFYSEHYNQMLFGKSSCSSFASKAHKSMEIGYREKFFSQVLEIGGGTGEHLDFVRHSFDKYIISDLRLPKLNKKWSNEKRITPLEANVESLPFEDSSFDRVIVTCLLHHVEKPEQALEEIKRVLKPGGVATIFLSCDPGMMVRFLRVLFTKRQAGIQGFAGYNLMIAREHRNHVGSLLEMSKYVFRHRRLKVDYFPFKVPSWNLNGYIILQIS